MKENPNEPTPPRAGRGGVAPPVEHRFKPGHSGNPSGRPKRLFTDMLHAYLGMDGQLRARRLVRELYDQALKGNRTAMRLVVGRLDRLDVDLADENLELLEQAFLNEQPAIEAELTGANQYEGMISLPHNGRDEHDPTYHPGDVNRAGDIVEEDGVLMRVLSCHRNLRIVEPLNAKSPIVSKI